MNNKTYKQFVLSFIVSLLLSVSGFSYEEEFTGSEKKPKSISLNLSGSNNLTAGNDFYRNNKVKISSHKAAKFLKKIFQISSENIFTFSKSSNYFTYKNRYSHLSNILVNLSFLKELRISRMRC